MKKILVVTLLSPLFALAQLNANFTSSINAMCSPAVISFTNLSTGNPDAYFWNFGNGNTSTSENPTAVYINPGYYDVELIIEKAGIFDTILIDSAIQVFNDPIFNIVSDVQSGCVPLTVNFSGVFNNTDTLNSQILWDFGDGNTDITFSPNHTYQNSGNYTVSVVVINENDCNTQETYINYITVAEKPNVDFTSVNNQGCSLPLNVSFTANDSYDSYNWSFGDGTSSSSSAPTHNYTQYGQYDVTLIASNANACFDTITKNDLVSLDSLYAEISMSSNSVCQNQQVSFDGISNLSGIQWMWDFDDGFYEYNQNSSHEYTDVGIFNIQATATLGNCLLSFDTVLDVHVSPIAGFTSQYLDSCTTPISVNFLDQSIGGTNYHWDFGDSTTSNLQNPNHIYSNVNSYDIMQVVSNSMGCNDTLIISSHIDLLPPTANFTSSDSGGCIPLTISFTDNSFSTLSPVVSWDWDFGNGQTSTSQNPSCTYTASGSYDVSLVVSNVQGCTDTILMNSYITAGDTVTSPDDIGLEFTPSVFAACASEGVLFSIDTVGVVPSDTWVEPYNFENDSFAIGTPLSPPALEINQGGCLTLIPYSDMVTLYPPTAQFSISKTCNSNTITFNIGQSGVDSSVFIVEGVDTFINQSIVNYTFPGNGIYSASLETFNFTYGCDDFTVKNFSLAWPIADFELSDTLVCAPASVQFNNLSENATYYIWELDTGVATILENPNHLYTNSGIYDITLIAFHNQCADTLVKEDALNVRSVTALFEADTTSGCAPLEINFSDLSTSSSGNITSYFWEFGDGTTSTQQNPSHIYYLSKNYHVSLTVTDSTTGCSSTSHLNNYINMLEPNPKFDVDTLVCMNNEVTFVNQTPLMNSLTFLWNFGDGTTSTQQSPTHVYDTPGVYTITLTATNVNGCDSTITKENILQIDSITADFEVDGTYGYCPPFLVNFTDISENNIIDWQWDFGDGSYSTSQNPTHLFGSVDSFDVSLIIQNMAGCIDTVSKENLIVVDGPFGSFNVIDPIGCIDHDASIEVLYSNTSSRIFDFGDGNVVETLDSIVYNTYTNEGTYFPSVVLFDDSVCTIVYPLDTIMVGALSAEFEIDKDTVCIFDDVFTTNLTSSSSPLTNYTWNFGDGSEYQTVDAVHQYSNGGNYDISLIAVNEFCSDTFSLNNPIFVDGSLNSQFSVNDSNICELEEITLTCISESDFAITNYSWLINDLEVSSDHHCDFVFNNSGNYSIELIVENSNGCTSNITKEFIVGSLPKNEIEDTLSICHGTSKSILLNPNHLYQWSPNEFLSCNDCNDIEIAPLQTTDYAIIVETEFGCVDTFEMNVSVLENPVITASEDLITLLGDEERLWATSSVNNLNYYWSPNENLSCADCSSTNFTANENTLFTVTGTDENGCFGTEDVYVEVINPCEDNFMYIPNAFTPNHDGKNDVFSPKSVLEAPITSFYVFDRWGKVLFAGNEDVNGWDGTYNGIDVNAGVYVYMIELLCNNGQKAIHNGNVTVLR